MSLIISVLLYASETWTLTKVNLDRLPVFRMSCYRHFLGELWLQKVRNNEMNRTKLPHIGNIIQKRRHSLFGHVVRKDPRTPAHTSLKLVRDMSMGLRISSNWRRPRWRPRRL